MEKKKDWLGLIFIEAFVFFVFVASWLGFFYAEYDGGVRFLVPLVWWLKIIFISLAVLCGWLLYWVPKNWFKN